MKFFVKLCIAAMLLVSIVSCDALRRLAGRPTSDEMEAKLQKIEQIEEARLKAQERSKAENDSIKASRPTAKERAAESKSIQQKAFERAEAEALAKSQAKAAAAEARQTGTQDVRKMAKEAVKQAVKQSSSAQEVKQNVKQAAKQEIKQTAKQEAKQEVKQTASRQNSVKTESNAPSKFDAVIGSFIYEENANRLYARVQADGYDPRIIKQGQWTAVFVNCHAENHTEAVQFMDKIRKEPFCPKDAWLRSR